MRTKICLITFNKNVNVWMEILKTWVKGGKRREILIFNNII